MIKHLFNCLLLFVSCALFGQKLKDNNQISVDFKEPSYWLNNTVKSSTSTSGLVSLSVNQDDAVPPPAVAADGNIEHTPRLRCHYIWGDGEYDFFFPESGMKTTFALDQANRNNKTHQYLQNGTFPITIVSTKAYNDVKPAARLQTTTDNLTGITTGNFASKFPSTVRGNVWIEQQHLPRNGFPTAFAVSYRNPTQFTPLMGSTPQKLVFLYGCTQNSLIPGETAWHADNKYFEDNPSNRAYTDAIPAYFPSGFVSPTPESASGLTDVAFNGGFPYASYLSYDLSGINAAAASNHADIRVFPILNSKTWEHLPGNIKFRAVLLGKGVGTTVTYKGISYNILGEYTADTYGVETNDPPEFIIEDVCKQWWKSDSYLVTFSLSFCNDGEAPETFEKVKITSNGLFSKLTFLESRLASGYTSTSNPIKFNIPLNSPYDRNSREYKTSCATVQFTMETSAAGLDALKAYFLNPGSCPTTTAPLSAAINFENSSYGERCLNISDIKSILHGTDTVKPKEIQFCPISKEGLAILLAVIALIIGLLANRVFKPKLK
jgi:hypothetical protein